MIQQIPTVKHLRVTLLLLDDFDVGSIDLRFRENWGL
jgi:hypothetical protein